MSKVIGILIVIVCLYGLIKLLNLWQEYKKRDSSGAPPASQSAAENPVAPEALPGLPPTLEASLQAAQKEGATALGVWLKRNRPYVQDPRLASIEMDYIALIVRQNPGEARRLFAEVKKRTPADSPVHPRVKRMEKAYE